VLEDFAGFSGRWNGENWATERENWGEYRRQGLRRSPQEPRIEFSAQPCAICRHDIVRPVRDFLVLAIHLIVTLAKLLRLGGAKAVAPNRWRLNSN
jgi:hypothetical protein